MTLHTHTFTRGHLTLVHSAPAPHKAPEAQPEDGCDNLTSRDMIALHCWMHRPELHGYCRTVIEVGDGACEPESGGYALFYEPTQACASWGVRREGDDLVVWHCGRGSDKGRYPTMQAALDSLPIVWRAASRTRDAAPRRDGRSTVVRLA